MTVMEIKKGVSPFSQKEYDILFKLYVKQDMTIYELADKLKASPRTLFNRLKAHGISKTKSLRKKLKFCTHCGQSLQQRVRQQ